jgi:ferredoxin-NADP reductase
MPTSPSTPFAVAATQRLAGWLTQLGMSRHAFDDTVSLINPLLTVTQLHARVVERRPETPSACTFVLRAGPAFRGLRPGQFVMIGIEIGGVRHRRAYSPRALENRPDCFAITVQRQVGGVVSNHLHDKVKAGDIIEIEQASGEFVLAERAPERLLLIAGGSGITPCMAMIQHLQKEKAPTRITLIYFARSQTERIFARELQTIAKQWAGLVYVALDSVANTPGQPAVAQPVLDETLLNQHVPGWQSGAAYCCGPAPLMDAARGIWRQAGISQQLKLEAFGVARASGDPSVRHQVAVVRNGAIVHFDAPGNLTVLDSSEKAGLALKHGCRQGICHECVCRLQSGIVKDLITGEQVEGDGQPVRICVTAAMSDLQLESLN